MKPFTFGQLTPSRPYLIAIVGFPFPSLPFLSPSHGLIAFAELMTDCFVCIIIIFCSLFANASSIFLQVAVSDPVCIHHVSPQLIAGGVNAAGLSPTWQLFAFDS